jgi:hypothetical protein
VSSAPVDVHEILIDVAFSPPFDMCNHSYAVDTRLTNIMRPATTCATASRTPSPSATCSATRTLTATSAPTRCPDPATGGSSEDGFASGWAIETIDLRDVYALGDLRGRDQVWISFPRGLAYPHAGSR